MFDLFLPRRCPYCDRPMHPHEEEVCLSCLARLPRVHAEAPGNEVENRLFGQFPFEHAASFCYYTPEGDFGSIIRRAKFGDKPWLNTQLTQLFVKELQMSPDSGWPFDIEAIVPIPLHTWRLLSRGYNQSIAIAEALSRAWHLPLQTECLYKRRYTRSQIGLSGQERRKHEEGTFGVRHPERLAHRHILLVDDVITTGATITAAADALLEAAPGIRISVISLALAQS